MTTARPDGAGLSGASQPQLSGLDLELQNEDATKDPALAYECDGYKR
jgi:hypothetical protein